MPHIGVCVVQLLFFEVLRFLSKSPKYVSGVHLSHRILFITRDKRHSSTFCLFGLEPGKGKSKTDNRDKVWCSKGQDGTGVAVSCP